MDPVMATPIFTLLGQQLLQARHHEGFTQPQLAARLGRDRARISELERDLATGRLGRDRLTLFVEMCDALGVVPLLVPRNQVETIRAIVDTDHRPTDGVLPPATFDVVFVDLDDGAE